MVKDLKHSLDSLTCEFFPGSFTDPRGKTHVIDRAGVQSDFVLQSPGAQVRKSKKKSMKILWNDH